MRVCVDTLTLLGWTPSYCSFCTHTHTHVERSPSPVSATDDGVGSDDDKAAADYAGQTDDCDICAKVGDLIVCDTCPRCYHIACLISHGRVASHVKTADDLPDDWHCYQVHTQ